MPSSARRAGLCAKVLCHMSGLQKMHTDRSPVEGYHAVNMLIMLRKRVNAEPAATLSAAQVESWVLCPSLPRRWGGSCTACC